MASSHRSAPFGSAAYRSRDGLNPRVVGTNSDEIQVRVDPMHADLDQEIDGLYGQITKLKGVAQAIGSEAKFQNSLLEQLQNTIMQGEAKVKNSLKRLNRRIIQQGSNHVFHVILFALFCFFVVYLLAKFSRR